MTLKELLEEVEDLRKSEKIMGDARRTRRAFAALDLVPELAKRLTLATEVLTDAEMHMESSCPDRYSDKGIINLDSFQSRLREINGDPKPPAPLTIRERTRETPGEAHEPVPPGSAKRCPKCQYTQAPVASGFRPKP